LRARHLGRPTPRGPALHKSPVTDGVVETACFAGAVQFNSRESTGNYSRGVSSAESYRIFAEVEAKGHSATYNDWSNSISDDAPVLTLIDDLPERCRQPNLILACCRFLGVEPGPYDLFREFLLKRWSEVKNLALTKRTQTNEPGRCAVLLPLLASLPQPLALLEVGASAGLCLYPDRYGYDYDSDVQIDPRGGSEVSLACATRGDPPLPESLPDVVWRAGIDLNPLDVRDEPSMKWLEALVWPEQEFRLHRLRAAIDVARSDPPTLFRGDLVERLREVAQQAPHDATLVVFHSAVLAYLDEDRRSDFVDLVRSLPATWISNDGNGVVPSLKPATSPPRDPVETPFVLAQDGIPIAYTGMHGQTLDWL
jgi:hypothetical protein